MLPTKAEQIFFMRDNDRSQEVRFANQSSTYKSRETGQINTFDVISNDGMIYYNVITLNNNAIPILRTLSKQISKIFCTLNIKTEEFKLNLLRETNICLQFVGLTMVVTILLMLKKICIFFKRKLQNVFDFYSRPFMHEIEDIKQDTSKINEVLRDTNEKVSEIIQRKECEQKVRCNNIDPLTQSINQIRMLLKEKVREKRNIKSPKWEIHRKCNKITQNKDIATQTEDEVIKTYVPSTENNIIPKDDTTECKSVRERISQFRKKREAEVRSLSPHSMDVRRFQRIWIGGKWYLEGFNELKEAYSVPLFTRESHKSEKDFSSNKSNAHNISITSIKASDEIRTSTPSSTSCTPSFSKFMKWVERTNCNSLNRQRAHFYSQHGNQDPMVRTPVSTDEIKVQGHQRLNKSKSSPISKPTAQITPNSLSNVATFSASNNSYVFKNSQSVGTLNSSRSLLSTSHNIHRNITAKEDANVTFRRATCQSKLSKSVPGINRENNAPSETSFNPHYFHTTHALTQGNIDWCYSQIKTEKDKNRWRCGKSILKRVQSTPETSVKHVTLNL